MPAPPDALLLLTPQCPHCPAVLQALGELVKQGRIGSMRVVNLGAHPEVGAELGARAVPWIRIGRFELEGAHTQAELALWTERAGTREGAAAYLAEQLKGGKLDRVTQFARRDREFMEGLLSLMGAADTELTVRLGVSAAMEGMEGDPALGQAIPGLEHLARHADAHIRGDAAHCLGLTHAPAAAMVLQELAGDREAMVRDIAQEALDRLAGKEPR